MNRRRESKKGISLTWQNNNFSRATRFFVYLVAALHDYHVKMPNFTFCEGRMNLDMVDRNSAPEEFACI